MATTTSPAKPGTTARGTTVFLKFIMATSGLVFIGYVPNSEALAGQVALNERGEVITDEALRTDVPGVFAAGDVRTKRIRQVTTAVSDGTIAALTALEYLKSVA